MDSITSTELTQWAILAALAFYSYKNKTVRIFGIIVGLICWSAVLVQYYVTTGLFVENMFYYGFIALGACFFGRQNDLKIE
jgi:hypothetical protein